MYVAKGPAWVSTPAESRKSSCLTVMLPEFSSTMRSELGRVAVEAELSRFLAWMYQVEPVNVSSCSESRRSLVRGATTGSSVISPSFTPSTQTSSPTAGSNGEP